MAIDLVNKLGPVQIVGNQVVLGEQLSAPLDVLPTEQREGLRLPYAAALTHPAPLTHVVGDPAAWESNFGHRLDRIAVRLDSRPSDELRSQALHHPDPVMREQALFEYGDRNEPDAIELLCQAVERD